MKHRLLCIFAAYLFAVPQAASARCAFGNAIYAPAGASRESGDARERWRLRHLARPLGEDEDWREINQASYVLRIEEQVQRRSRYFGFAFPNGHAATRLTYLGDSLAKSSWGAKPEGPASPIQYFDRAHKLVGTDAAGPRDAPALLIMPELAAGFWYRHADGDPFAPPEGLWQVVGCAK